MFRFRQTAFDTTTKREAPKRSAEHAEPRTSRAFIAFGVIAALAVSAIPAALLYMSWTEGGPTADAASPHTPPSTAPTPPTSRSR